MREIKFRAWDKQRYIIGPVGTWDFAKSYPDPYYTLLQFTGLYDKNGKEIYEGDIVDDGHGLGEVKWLMEHCSFMVRTIQPSHKYHRLESDGQLKETEVVGNIYENPKLLDVSHDS